MSSYALDAEATANSVWTAVYVGDLGDPNGIVEGDLTSTYEDVTDPQNPVQWLKTTPSGTNGWVSANS